MCACSIGNAWIENHFINLIEVRVSSGYWVENINFRTLWIGQLHEQQNSRIFGTTFITEQEFMINEF